ncbi:MAG TPA: tripartite tricarboxylate transporter substrate binding protein [Burkholderiales bacterium]
MNNLKRFLSLIVVALSCAAFPALAEYPDKPVKIIVPYPPGGTTDILARVIAQRLSERLKQSFVVENRGGASGAIGTQAVAKSPADGYTLCMGTIGTHGINSALFKNLPYDAVKDFAPITIVGITPNVLTVHPSVPAKNLQELLALARAKPGTLNFGSTSPGGSPHMAGELFKTMANIDIAHIPYKGAGPMLIDLVGGQIQMGFDNMPSSIGHIRSGKLRAIAVTTTKRWPGAPDVPTMAESGLPGYEVSAWFGLLAPAGTPRPVVDLLYKNISDILKQPDMVKQLFELGAEPGGNTPEAFARYIAADVEKWTRVVAATGVKVE